MKAIKSKIKNVLPRVISYAILLLNWKIKRLINSIIYAGDEFYCPICSSKISAFIINEEGFADCPICGSGERHRVDWIFLSKNTNLLNNAHKKMLHVAPELFFISKCKKIKNLDYITIDLEDPRAQNKMDITNIKYSADFFDIIYCSHVLEHVIHDDKAIREFYRVLKKGGWAVLQVPVTIDKTFENINITTPEERKRVFGHEGHVRRCGLDYCDRIRAAAGFITKVDPNR